MTKITRIVTHRFPDLDALLCCWLLRRFGESRYPGIAEVPIDFWNAGDLPEGKTPEDLEREGTLLVDTGGGRLDTHVLEGDASGGPAGEDLSAAMLVARDLGVDRDPKLGQLLAFSVRQDARGQSFRSRDPIVHAIGLPGLVRGWAQINEKEDRKSLDLFCALMDSLHPVGADPISSILASLQTVGDISAGGVKLQSRTVVDRAVAHWLANRFPPRVPPSQESGETASRALARSGRVLDEPAMEKILKLAEPEFLREKFRAGENLSRELRLTLFGILHGARQQESSDPLRVETVGSSLIDSVYVREQDWFQAQEDYQDPKKKKCLKLQWGSGPVTLVLVSSTSRAIGRMARRIDRPDMVLWLNPDTGHVSVTLSQFTGRLRSFSLAPLAARFRVAECMRRGEAVPDIERIMDFGVECGWFLHQSTRILSRGSPKAPDREPTILTISEMENLITTLFEPDRKIDVSLGCPDQECTCEECAFFPLRLACCFRHRERLRGTEGMTLTSREGSP
ncbi:MAG: hypothetical protein QF752_03310 [Planctomycetota bacterium]|jgi:hypothetical protein|nr:hypothetical protein [Planctomycetota bacterium]